MEGWLEKLEKVFRTVKKVFFNTTARKNELMFFVV